MAVMRCPSCHREYEQGFLKCPFDGTALVDADAADAHDPFLGRQLAETYQLMRKLGAGGMGSVYEARHIRLETSFAIKFLRPELAINEEMLARFHREARAASQLKHPHILEVFDVNKTPDNLHYIVQEYLDGKPLSAVLEEQGTLPVARGAAIVAQVCDALAAAHAKGIVHRDIKPENLFLVRKDDYHDFVKVLDFGIAKMQEGRAKLTQAAQVMGTPDYISPEQASSAGEVDFRSDIYSLGVVVYRIFTGRLPYEIDNPALALHAVTSQDPVPPSQRRPDLPREIEAVIQRAMMRQPAARFQSMTELKDALLSLLTDQELASIAVVAAIRATPVGRADSTPVRGTPIPATVAASRDQITGPPQPSAGWNKLDVDSLRKGSTPTPIAGQLTPTTANRPGERSKLAPIVVATVAALAIGGSIAAYFLLRDPKPVRPAVADAAPPPARKDAGRPAPRPDTARPVAAERKDAGAAKPAGEAGMVKLAGGKFRMGRADGSAVERPPHTCTVEDFLLDEREVSLEEWAAFLATPEGRELAATAKAAKPPHDWSGAAGARGAEAQLPVTMVTWSEASAYCASKGKRLPTEKEWEYAARGPTHDGLYPAGKEPPGPEVANWSRSKVVPAKLRPASQSQAVGGLKDLIGNAGEWVADAFGGYTAKCDKRAKPNPQLAKFRMIRGGGFDDVDPTHLTATYRIPQDPTSFRWKSVGFRCAKNAR
jgi:serine/threonine-protein kinase